MARIIQLEDVKKAAVDRKRRQLINRMMRHRLMVKQATADFRRAGFEIKQGAKP